VRPQRLLLATSLALAAGVGGAQGAGAVDAAPVAPTVRDITAAVGVAAKVNDEYGTTAVCDLNRDGLDDWVLGRHQLAGTQVFYGQGDGTMKLHQVLPISDRHGVDCFTAVGDARPELFITVGADGGNSDSKSNEVWRTGSTGKLALVPGALGLSDPSGRGRLITHLDARGDGVADDVYIGNAPPEGFPSVNKTYLKVAGGYQENASGVESTTYGRCADAADYDKDGYDDLIAGNGSGVRLWHNRGDATFTDVADKYGISYAKACVFADVNRDGNPDLLTIGSSKLFVRLGDGNGALPLAYTLPVAGGAALAVADLNDDGSPDIYLVRGRADQRNQPDVLLLGNGTGRTFNDASARLPQTSVGDGHSVAVSRFQGRTRLIVLNGGQGKGIMAPRQVLEFTAG